MIRNHTPGLRTNLLHNGIQFPLTLAIFPVLIPLKRIRQCFTFHYPTPIIEDPLKETNDCRVCNMSQTLFSISDFQTSLHIPSIWEALKNPDAQATPHAN